MKSEAYWQGRMKREMDQIKNMVFEDYVHNIEENYDVAIKDIETQIRAWVQRFADNNSISYEEAQKKLKTKELEEFRWDVKEYIRRARIWENTGEWEKELENASARVHVSRLDVIEFKLKAHIEDLTRQRIKNTSEAVKLAYTESYEHTAFEIFKRAGVGTSFQAIDTRKLDRLLEHSWTADGMNFSARCWQDRDKLSAAVDKELIRMTATGDSPEKAIKNIINQFETSRANATRVIMTESAFASSKAQIDMYNELEVKKYKVISALDKRTCDYCGDMDQKVFERNKAQIGVNMPPFHPNCRCTTSPTNEEFKVIGERFARDVETDKGYYVPGNMTYTEWKSTQNFEG